MDRKSAGVGVLMAALVLSGCTVRTYPLVRDRVDQDLSSSAGNKGCLMGQCPSEEKDRKTTRSTQVLEIEFGEKAKAAQKTGVAPEQAYQPENAPYIPEPAVLTQEAEETVVYEPAPSCAMEKYTVQKYDTLQKISQKFYGTTKKWRKIFDANKDLLKTPDRIRPGQVLNIPVEAGQKSEGIQENLK